MLPITYICGKCCKKFFADNVVEMISVVGIHHCETSPDSQGCQ